MPNPTADPIAVVKPKLKPLALLKKALPWIGAIAGTAIATVLITNAVSSSEDDGTCPYASNDEPAEIESTD